MATGKELLESLGLEIAKRKYYNAAKVESVIEDLSGRSAALEEENAALRERVSALATGREEIGDAILSAKSIARQLIAEAQEEADKLLADAREKAARLVAEAEESSRVLREESEAREQKTVRTAEEYYLQLRGQCLETVKLLDGEWQRFLCSFGGEAPQEDKLPDDIGERLGELAECLGEIGEDTEAEQ